MKKIIILLISTLLTGCFGFSNHIKNAAQYKSAIDLADNGTKELSGYVSYLPLANQEKLFIRDGVKVFKKNIGYFMKDPNTKRNMSVSAKILQTHNAFNSYCININGFYKQTQSPFEEIKLGWCLKKNDMKKAYFAIETKATNYNFKMSKLNITVHESEDKAPSNKVLKSATNLDSVYKEINAKIKQNNRYREQMKQVRETMNRPFNY